MESPTGLLLLGDALSLILKHLSFSDRLRLSLVCRELCLACRKSVQHLLLSQQELEESDLFTVFPHATHIEVHEPYLNADLVSFLIGNSEARLQHLTSIQITDPSYLDSTALTLLFSVCTTLTSVQIHGGWLSDTRLQQKEQYPRNLEQLSLQHNGCLSPADLVALLTANPDVEIQRPLPAAMEGVANAHNMSGSNPDVSLTMPLELAPTIPNQPAWPHLQKLDLSACSKLGGSLDFLSLIPELETLVLHSCFKVTNSTLEQLHKALQTSCGKQDSSSYSSTSSGMQAVATPANGANPVDTAAATQLGYPALRQLDLSYTRVNDGGVIHVAAAWPQLQWLSLKGCNVGDDGLLHLLQLQQLTALHIKHCHRITEEGIQQLSALSGLRELSYGYTSMPDADDIAAAIAAQFKQLTGLDLLSSELTDKGLAALSHLQQLQQLHLYQAGISCNGLELFAQQPGGRRLHRLVLYGFGGLTALECLGAFSRLQDLQLGCLCDLEDVPAAVQQLTAAKHLTSLTLERVDGISVHILQHVLGGCRELMQFRVRGCDGVSQDDMEQLAASSAQLCRSSASLYWADSASADTDDEDGGDRLLYP